MGLLENLEMAIGDKNAAAQARQQAIESYLDYRHAGGQNTTGGAQLCISVAQAISQGDTTKIEQRLAQFSGVDVPPFSNCCSPNCKRYYMVIVILRSPIIRIWTIAMPWSCNCCWKH
jgi:hypothetical protein